MNLCASISVAASLALASLALPIPAIAASEPSPVSGKGVPSPILQGVHRVVFLGDSITQAGDYVADIECWLCAQNLGIEVINLGLGSETATDLTPEENASHLAKYGFGRPFLSQRLDRVLAATKPDLLFACYGMNDGSSLPANAQGDRRFADAVTHLREAALRAGVKRVILCTPPVHDAHQDPTQKAQDQNLTRYTTWLLSKRASGWDIVDIHTPMRQALDEGRSKDQAFLFAQDGVHPARPGHWLMAREILVQCFGANLQGVTRAEDLLPAHGSEIRKLICQRMNLLFDAWMTQIGHTRPGVAGGPGAKRSGVAVPEADARAAEITTKILKLQGTAAIDSGRALDASDTRQSRLVIHANEAHHTISRNIYGHFSEHLGRGVYEGIWVGEDSSIPNTRGIRNDVVEALKEIKVPVLRWPGGCFADEYHWRDGIGPREKRPSMINTHWGGVVENNHFGTHEFMDLCEQIGCQPYICGNVGSGTVQEMQQWVEYITFPGLSPLSQARRNNGREQPWKLPYFGIGNENWGCGGNMTPEYYASQYKRYATYVRSFGDNRIYKIACGPNGADTNWTEVLMREAGKRMDGLALHFYCGSSRKKSPAAVFDEADWFHQLKNALRMEDLVTRHSAIMDKYDPEKKVALIVDEWGAWHSVEPGTNPRFLYQQNTLRDALVAACSLNVFNNHCDRVRMANIAQMVNVLQAVVLTDKEKILLTPTWHVFQMFTVHHDARFLPADLQTADCPSNPERLPQISVSASKDKSGKIHVTLCNLDPKAPANVTCRVEGSKMHQLSGRVLTASEMNAHNTFESPKLVQTVDFTGFMINGDGFTTMLPAKSVVVLDAH